MSTCKACGKSVRKTSLAFVLGMGMGRVCAECLSWGLTVVGVRVAPVQKTVVKASDDLQVALRTLRMFRRTCDDDRRAEGLDQAIGVLESKLERMVSS